MGGVRNNDLRPFLIPAALVPGTNQQKSRKFAVGAGRRLERHAVHSCYLTEYFLRSLQDLQGALNGGFRLQRMNSRKSGESGDLIIDLWIVFHGAGTQGIAAVVDTVGRFGQLRIMAAYVIFRYLGKAQRKRSRALRHHVRHVGWRQNLAVTPVYTSFKYQFHAQHTSFTRSARRSISSFVFISVAHQSMRPPGRGRPPK